MRKLILAPALAVALAFSAGGAAALAQDKPSGDAIQQLADKGEDERAFALAQQGAEAGDPLAHEWLGFFYDKGRGTGADPALAAEHYRIAAAGGRNYARWRLGVMIDTGEAEGDLEEAVALFSAAADDGYANAMTSLAVMQATGRGTPVDYEASLESYMRAARLGDGHGIQGVGVLFARGEGVPRDFTEASAWFMVGVMVGNEVAQDNLMAMFQHMNDEEKAAAVARANEIAAEFGIDSDIAYDPDFVPPSRHETK